MSMTKLIMRQRRSPYFVSFSQRYVQRLRMGKVLTRCIQSSSHSMELIIIALIAVEVVIVRLYPKPLFLCSSFVGYH